MKQVLQRGSTKIKVSAFIALASIAGAGLFVLYAGSSEHPALGSNASRPNSPDASLRASTALATQMPASSVSPTAKSIESTQNERFDLLSRSESSKSRFEAYQLAQRCLLESELDRVPGINYIRQCDLQPGKWGDGQSRTKLIVRAALEGVWGAWWALRDEGPGGRFNGFAESPDYRDLESKSYQAALTSADPFALAHEAEVQQAQGNIARALTMNVASAASLSKLQRRTGAYDPEQDPNLDLTFYRLRLNPEAAKQAIHDGLKLSAAAR